MFKTSTYITGISFIDIDRTGTECTLEDDSNRQAQLLADCDRDGIYIRLLWKSNSRTSGHKPPYVRSKAKSMIQRLNNYCVFWKNPRNCDYQRTAPNSIIILEVIWASLIWLLIRSTSLTRRYEISSRMSITRKNLCWNFPRKLFPIIILTRYIIISIKSIQLI